MFGSGKENVHYVQIQMVPGSSSVKDLTSFKKFLQKQCKDLKTNPQVLDILVETRAYKWTRGSRMYLRLSDKELKTLSKHKDVYSINSRLMEDGYVKMSAAEFYLS